MKRPLRSMLARLRILLPIEPGPKSPRLRVRPAGIEAALPRLRSRPRLPSFHWPLPLRRLAGLAGLAGLAAFAACGQNYSVSVNDRAVFDPTGRLPSGEVVDANLQGCINFALAQQSTNGAGAAELPVLACPGSEVATLEGIGLLSGLRFLDLGGNNIGNVTPLEDLPLLSALNLAENPFTDAGPLLNIANLSSLNLRGNERIPCPQIAALRQRLGDNLLAPANCD